MKNKVFFVFIIIIFIIFGYYIINKNNENDVNKLIKLGYSDNDINLFNSKNISDDIIINYGFIDGLSDIVKDNRFDIKNIDFYVNSLREGKSVIDIYLISCFMNEKYYITSRLDRYISYYNSHNDLSFKEIVKRVNSNVDYDFYTHIFDAKESDGYLILCNKFSKLNSDKYFNLVSVDSKYGSGKMEKEAYSFYKKMSDDASGSGISFKIVSPFRSLADQRYIYNDYVKRDGVSKADTYSARSGHSEHNTGLGIDLGYIGNSFKNTPEYKWLIDNSYKYGFILRYPEGEEYITGYIYEPWHFRYVGVDAAKIIYSEGITFEEYYAFYVENKD